MLAIYDGEGKMIRVRKHGSRRVSTWYVVCNGNANTKLKNLFHEYDPSWNDIEMTNRGD